MTHAPATSPDVEAIRLVESKRFQILSLDIFDTTVWRTFPAPTDLFYALGNQLLQAHVLYPSASAASFASERIEAERKARNKRQGSSEVSLDEIYECFPRGYLRSGGVHDVMEAELALERDSTRADPGVLAVIDAAVSAGLRLAFVSDTYFDETHIRSILPRKADYLLRSCEFRKSKSAGLHQELARASGVRPESILHIGDNLEADVKAPARLGIATLWRPRTPELFAQALQTELPATRSERSAYFSAATGDSGLSALRARAVTAGENWTDPFRSWGALFLGPVMAGFGKWVGERCKEEGIGAALCFMREGRILRQVLQSCAPELETEELFVSRYAMIRASIFCGDATELTRYLARPQPMPARELLGPLGIEPAEAGVDGEVLVAAASAQKLAQVIAGSPAMRRKAQQASAVTRRNFLRYFERTTANRDERIAVVDLGYSGTIQNCLQAILDHEGIPCRTHGLYFVTGADIRKIQSTGTPAEGYMGENGQPLAIGHSFMRSPEVVEQCLMCDLGSTMDYDDAGSPVLGTLHLPAPQLEQIEQVKAGLLDFVSCASSEPCWQAASSAQLRPFLESILIRSLTRPVAAELECFGNWVHDENFGSSNTRRLIDTDLEPDYLYHASAHQLASVGSGSSYWIFGTAHQQHPLMGEAVRSIFLRKLAPEAFQCPEDERPLYFFWNDGETHRAESTYALSSRRTAWSRFTIDVRDSDVREVGFAVGQPGDVLRVRGIILRLHRAGRPTEEIRVPPAELDVFGMNPIEGATGTYLVTDVAGFAASTPTIRDFTGRVDVDVLFSQLPTGEPWLC